MSMSTTKTELISSFSKINPQQIESIIDSKLDQISPKAHTHTPPEITGIMEINQGGTGANNPASARTNLGISPENIGATPASHITAINPHNITPALINAAPLNHSHSATDISGTLPVERGGTGGNTPAIARSNLQITPVNIGAASAIHNHSIAEITGTLSINQGGTGANSAAQARNNLGITPENIGAAAANHAHIAIEITNFTFENGWRNYYVPEWRIRIFKFFNLVIINGAVERISGTQGRILNLPPSCFPINNLLSMTLGYWSNNYRTCRIDCLTNGVIELSPHYPHNAPEVIQSVSINLAYITTN